MTHNDDSLNNTENRPTMSPDNSFDLVLNEIKLLIQRIDLEQETNVSLTSNDLVGPHMTPFGLLTVNITERVSNKGNTKVGCRTKVEQRRNKISAEQRNSR